MNWLEGCHFLSRGFHLSKQVISFGTFFFKCNVRVK